MATLKEIICFPYGVEGGGEIAFQGKQIVN